MATKNKKKWTLQETTPLIEKFDLWVAEGLTAKEVAAKEGMSTSRYYNIRKRHRELSGIPPKSGPNRKPPTQQVVAGAPQPKQSAPDDEVKRLIKENGLLRDLVIKKELQLLEVDA